MTVAELLTDKSKWTKNAYARNKSGRRVDCRSSGATRWCLAGAMDKCYGFSPKGANAVGRLLHAIASRGHHTTLSGFNDDPSTTFEDVRSIIEEADI